jgi:hypothetical protein
VELKSKMETSMKIGLAVLLLAFAPLAQADQLSLTGDAGPTAPFCALANMQCFPASFVLDVEVTPAGYSDFSGQLYTVGSITGTFDGQSVTGSGGMLSGSVYFPGGGILGPEAPGDLRFMVNGNPWEIGFGTFGPDDIVLSVFAQNELTGQDTLVTWTADPLVQTPVPTPEPVTLGLLMLGLATIRGYKLYLSGGRTRPKS